VLLSAKFLDDHFYSNAHFAKIGGVSLAELNALERDLLRRLDFRLHIYPAQFEEALSFLADRLTPDEMSAASEAEQSESEGWSGASPVARAALPQPEVRS